MILGLHHNLARRSDPTHRREVITGQPHGEIRSLAHGDKATNGHGKQRKGRVIHEDAGPFFLLAIVRASRPRWLLHRVDAPSGPAFAGGT